MHLNTFKYKPEHVDCSLCTEYKKKTGCAAHGCPWLADRIEAGVVGYAEAAREIFAKYPGLQFRQNLLIRLFPGTFWVDERHKKRMDYTKALLGFRRKRDTSKFFAAMYLITANEDIYKCAANCLYKKGFDYSFARLRGISTHNYTLLMAVRGIYENTDGLTIADLADPYVVGPEAFRLIVNAALIARYGMGAMKLGRNKPD